MWGREGAEVQSLCHLRNEFGSIRGIAVGCAGLGARTDAGRVLVDLVAERGRASKMVAQVLCLPQLPLPRHLLWFSRGLSVRALPSRVCAGQPLGSCRSCPAAISPGYCCPDLFVIGRSGGCLRDSGTTWRFLGSDAAAGDGLHECGGRGLGARRGAFRERGDVFSTSQTCPHRRL